MSQRRVPRALTEEATLQLRSTYQDYVASAQNRSEPSGRILSTTTFLGQFDAVITARQGCFLRLISIVEAYVDMLSASLFNDQTPPNDPFIARLVREAEMRAATTWVERQRALEGLHGVPLGSLPNWSQLKAGIEVRNTIAHGLGRLTTKQRRDGKDLKGKLAQIQVELREGRLVITEGSLLRCLDVCLDFLASLDAAVPVRQ